MPSDNTALLRIPVSPGELLDKFSILCIKLERIIDAERLKFVTNEVETLRPAISQLRAELKSFEDFLNQLLDVNSQLWDVEDSLRDKESQRVFDGEFIRLARSVYRLNDHRAALKRKINSQLNCAFAEQKQHPRYVQ